MGKLVLEGIFGAIFLFAGFGVLSAFGSQDLRAPHPVTIAEIACATSPLDHVTTIGEITAIAPSKSKGSLNLTLSDAQGFTVTATLADTVEHLGLHLHDKVAVIGNTIGPKALMVSRKDGIRLAAPKPFEHKVLQVEVVDGEASWQHGKAPSALPNGFYEEARLQVDARGKASIVL